MKETYNINEIRNTIIQGDALEELRKFPSNSVNMVMTSPPYWCYAEGHKVLTGQGWKDLQDIQIGDRILSVNPKNMELEYVKITAVNKWKYSDKMVEFKNTHIDLLVTPNHKMFVYFKNIGKGIKPRDEVGYFKSTKNKKGRFFVEAKNIKSDYVTAKTGFKWNFNRSYPARRGGLFLIVLLVRPKVFGKSSALFP